MKRLSKAQRDERTILEAIHAAVSDGKNEFTFSNPVAGCIWIGAMQLLAEWWAGRALAEKEKP